MNKILRAGNDHEKEYLVTVDKPITDEFIRGMGAVSYTHLISAPLARASSMAAVTPMTGPHTAGVVLKNTVFILMVIQYGKWGMLVSFIAYGMELAGLLAVNQRKTGKHRSPQTSF